MLNHKKIFAILAIAVFLSAIPLVCAQSKPQYVLVVNELRMDSNYAKPSGGGGGKPSGSVDYMLLGIKWSKAALPINLYVDGRVVDLDSGFVLDAVSQGTIEWDSYTRTTLVRTVTTSSTPLEAETDKPDFINEVVFGPISDPYVIAVTNTWYNSLTKQIVEFDITFSTSFTWGDGTFDNTIMDLQNIATHELGHGFGLADLYNDESPTQPLQTMYGLADFGETMKRSLESGDIAGIRAIYGR